MTEPRYILLTVKKITVPTSKGHSQTTIVQPPVVKLFPLPMPISKAQHSREAEIDVGSGMVLTMAEDFQDVLEALESAASSGRHVVRPIARGAIAEAVSSVSSFRRDIEDAIGLGGAVIDGAADFARRAEGAKHQDEAVEAVESAPDYDAAQDIATWADARPVKPGDLRIATDHVNHWIEVANVIEKNYEAGELDKATSFEWARFGVPPELLPIYETAEAARQAVKLAGYSRRLIEA